MPARPPGRRRRIHRAPTRGPKGQLLERPQEHRDVFVGATPSYAVANKLNISAGTEVAQRAAQHRCASLVRLRPSDSFKEALHQREAQEVVRADLHDQMRGLSVHLVAARHGCPRRAAVRGSLAVSPSLMRA
ncbi:hypothetical protein [Antrihabitans stalactiti]|uniref:hypothetical protein n=1 Tax=Antrihabitans stalactiti TaxID=2584121 RepID=UPI00146A3A47|nr:hypothetical protein [Antrihabitans stalactiti]